MDAGQQHQPERTVTGHSHTLSAATSGGAFANSHIDERTDDEVLRQAYAEFRDHPMVMQLASRLERANEQLDALVED